MSTESTSQVRPVLNALALRHLAEKADGHRGEPLCLVFRSSAEGAEDGASGFLVVPRSKVNTAGPGGDDVLVDIETPFYDPRRAAGLKEVWITHQDGRKEDATHKYDALFWSEPAIEKFMFGYYLRNLNDEDWRKLHDAYLKPTADVVVYGFGHLPDSTWEEISDQVPDSVHVFSNQGTHSIRELLSFL